jgi:tRNA (guanine6-N2)-methyltransferase
MSLRLIVRCVHGVEWFCADEVSALLPEAGDLTLGRREVTFELPTIDPALLALSTADDAYLEVGRLDGTGTTKDVPDALAARLARLPWQQRIEDIRRLRPVATEPLLDIVASLEGRRSYNRFAVENAAGRLIASLVGGFYLERSAAGRAPGDPDLTARLFVRGETTIAALRVPHRPLHRRGYKLDTAPGTLHPPVAAALARLSVPAAGTSVRDPFCGDGTIAIETALAYPAAHVSASDLDPVRLENTRRNAERAGVRVSLSVRDAGTLTAADGPVDAVVTNPPWNLNVAGGGTMARSLRPFWRRLPDLLADTGRLVAIADADQDLPKALRAAGFRTVLGARIRLVGRLSDIVLAAPNGRPEPALPQGLARWRERTIAAGVVTRSGF